jgi:uncharacterized membrane protein
MDGGARCINDKGQIAGLKKDRIGGRIIAVFWDKGELTEIKDFRGVGDINTRGQVVGSKYAPYKALMWENGVVTELWDDGQAFDINEHGQVIGNKGLEPDSLIPILWDKGTLTQLWNRGSAYAINSNGQVVGELYTNNEIVAVLWEKGTVKQLWEEGTAFKINDRGQILGYRSGYTVLWDKGTITELFRGDPYGITNQCKVLGYSNESGNYEVVLWEKR